MAEPPESGHRPAISVPSATSTSPAGRAKTGHETRDANIKGVVVFAGTLTVILVSVMLMMRGLFGLLSVTQSLGPPASPFENVRQLPPEPRLQVQPRQEMRQFRANEDQQLSTYGWVDRKAGIVHIPIDRAMDLLLEKGLPARSGTENAAVGVEGRAERSDFAPPATREIRVAGAKQ